MEWKDIRELVVGKFEFLGFFLSMKTKHYTDSGVCNLF